MLFLTGSAGRRSPSFHRLFKIVYHMKRTCLLLIFPALFAGLSSCDKLFPDDAPKEIVFGISSNATKVTEVTTANLTSFYVLATQTSGGTETDYWGGQATATKSGDDYLTGKYWTEDGDPELHFYASNASLTFSASGPTVTADGSQDVVVAYKESSSYKARNALTFSHIFSRVGNVTLETQSGYELSAVSATLKDAVTSGTYNLKTGAWVSSGTPADVPLGTFSGSTSAQTSGNDLYVVPGTYSINVNYTLTKNGVSTSFSKTGTVVISFGKNNTITAESTGGN